MFGFGRAIALSAYVNSNEFETTREEMAFSKVQRETIGAADDELAAHVKQGTLEGRCPADDVVNNDARISIVVNGDAVRFTQLLPYAVDIVDEIDKRGWSVGRAKRHDGVCPFDGVDPLECQLFLTCKRDGKLMIAHRRVEHPPP